MMLGLGVDYGPSRNELGLPAIDPALTGQFPFGSIGDQFQTCVDAGGDPTSCSMAVVSSNPSAGAAVVVPGVSARPGAAPSSNKTLLLAALVFFGVVVLRTR